MEGPLNRDEDLLLIRDMIYEGSWNLNLCFFDFPAVLRMKIKAIPIPFSDARVDGLCWSNSPSGEFNGRSAYKLACGVSQLQCNFKGQRIWKLDTLPKIQCFVWKCYMKCLPVKSLLVYQGIAKVNQCKGCGSELETMLHMLRTMPQQKTFWQRPNIDICNDNFFNVDLCSWLKNNLENSLSMMRNQLPWMYFFAFGIWKIWLFRN